MDVQEAAKVVDRNARVLLLKSQLFEQLMACVDDDPGHESLAEHAAGLRDRLKESQITNILIQEEFAKAPELFDAYPGKCAKLLQVLNFHQTAATAVREALRKYGEKERQNSRGDEAAREIEEFLIKVGRRDPREPPN